MTTPTVEAAATGVGAAESGTGHGRRWPLQPLLDACRLTPAMLAAHLRAGGNAVTLAAHRGLSDRQADRWAIRLGFHPVLVWGWAWVDAAATPDTTAPHARVAHDLRVRIERGELRPGEPLPTVKALAQRWSVGDKTITAATAELQRDGFVTGGGKGQRPVVAHPGAVECQVCGECGEPIEPATEHYPHRWDCALAAAGWCDCDYPTHPQCCLTCPSGGRP